MIFHPRDGERYDASHRGFLFLLSRPREQIDRESAGQLELSRDRIDFISDFKLSKMSRVERAYTTMM